jgi:ArsR family transcriptional regulator
VDVDSDVSDDTIQDLSEVFKMLSDGNRLRILLALARNGAMNVTALKDLLDQLQPSVKHSQPAVSHHLSLLKSSRLVRCDRQGRNNCYRLDSKRLGVLLEQFFSEAGNDNRSIQFEELALSLKRG